MASGPDIITYIGVPLAVLGVLPILYNTTLTLAALSKVKQTLRKSRLAGITRGDIINHVIEVELPRFTIAPLDRDEQSSLYWSVYNYPSLLTGGTWTIFNWKMHAIGLKTQRIEYADQLRQPQADIGFEELISYLLDLGAVPNPVGFRMLRTSGLWIPTGTALLWSPDQTEKCLSIAPLDDSDGNLSLSVRWSKRWRMRDKLSLPPYWIRIEGPDPKQIELDAKRDAVLNDEEVVAEAVDPFLEKSPSVNETNPMPSKEDPDAFSTTSKTVIEDKPVESIRCHISIDGLLAAMPEHEGLGTLQDFPITHLSIHPSNPNSPGVWFASAITALGASTKTVLWNYLIPLPFLIFSRKDAIPCGILVLLSAVAESDTPEWATQYDDEAERRELQYKRMRDQSAAMMREGSLTAEQRALAQRERFDRFVSESNDDRRQAQRRETQRAETRMLEALQSPRWDNGLVAGHMLAWLKREGYICESYGMHRAVEVLLHKALRDIEFAGKMTEMLDMWRAWVDNGGMRKADFVILKEKQAEFAYASLILAVVRESVVATDGSVGMDLQESVRIWKRVRLG